MPSGRTFQREGVTYLKARWPYRFVLQSLGPGTSRRDNNNNIIIKASSEGGRVGRFPATLGANLRR